MTDKKNKVQSHSALSEALKSISFAFSVKNLGYLPRWIILSLDIIMVLISGFLGHLLFKGIGIHFKNNYNFFLVATLYMSVSIFFFWIFRTYAGIIRHSGFIDAVKLFMAQSCTFLSLLFLNTFFDVFKHGKLFLNTRLFISIVLSFCFLLLYRIIVKQVFEHYLNESKANYTTKALIYGADANSVSVANALRFETPLRFKIIGFIDKENKNSSKRLLDLPILSTNRRVPVLLRSRKADALIIADNTLSKDEKLEIVSDCLNYNFKVFNTPKITDWEDPENISKKIKSFQIQDLLERPPIQLDNLAISNQIKGKTILITGAAGSIGSEIVWQVSAFDPAKIILLDQAETPLHHLSIEIGNAITKSAVETIIADIRNLDAIESVFISHAPDIVYHAAAYKHVPLMEENPAQAIFTNVQGTKNLADLSVKYNVERFVMVSTDKAVNPSNVMGASKRIAEKYVQSLNIHLQSAATKHTKFITTRFGNVLGSNGSVVPLFTKQIENGGPITITHPEIIRYFMTIPEACQLVLEAGAMGSGGELFIFDMGKPVKIIDLAYKMIRLAGLRPEKDVKIQIVGLRPGEKLFEELLNDSSKTLPTHHEKIMIAKDETENYADVSELVNELIETAKGFDSKEIVIRMKAIVPEYISMNSAFTSLDV
ncbi:polysaccharide biosynthesis protein [Flavobacterium sp. SM15]|uniref:polysaccharide biosynthesis protein n=1 Tax=Flavobacterium sp. SM15 TaxID=2908005 RepID=UPI001EDB1E54|nr:nucleoside-diphosphate sugar epimerase/dehydratase [Flavobacterium sp. SM15]MCG2611274.1 polysaccharide biosynthesis protein [Flavobacterium sp. SM15]